MSTTATFDATAAMPRVRPALPSVEPRTTESLHRYARTIARIFVAGAAAGIVGVALFSIDIDAPRANDRGCIYFANPQNSRAHPHVSGLAIERNWYPGGLQVLREPAGTDWIATGDCVGP
jgi:hypothetical protein